MRCANSRVTPAPPWVGRLLLCGLLWCGASLAGGSDTPGDAGAQVPAAPGPIVTPPPEPEKKGFLYYLNPKVWYNPSTAPFIPIPEIATDPDSGTTLGIIPTWVESDENHQVRRIIAPDFLHNPYFGYGAHGRIYEYSSGDEQWSAVAGVKEKVERSFDAEYQKGRLREERWSLNYSVIYDRDGAPRFYGYGNESLKSTETNYTSNQELLEVQAGFNITHAWQILYTSRLRVVEVLPGTLDTEPSIQVLFPNLEGLHTNKEFLNRVGVIYDTRDDITIPTHGAKIEAYGGVASRHGLINSSLFAETGVDGRGFWPVADGTVLAAHVALRYLPAAHELPFWALSALGGGQSEIGGSQQLRGFGNGRFYDRDSFSSTLELRRRVFTFDAVTTNVDIECAPFIDVGRVFGDNGTNPLEQLHKAYGVGFRGIARPFVVGYVDVGRGSEGVAVFTGLNYPF